MEREKDIKDKIKKIYFENQKENTADKDLITYLSCINEKKYECKSEPKKVPT